jgi:hypothetical protein
MKKRIGGGMEIFTSKNCARKISFIAVCIIVLLFFIQFSQSARQGEGSVIQFSAVRWEEYRNDRQGYSLRLPPELKRNFIRERDREEAAQSLLPFDYANFSPVQTGKDQEPFELGLGVHWNKYNMTTRAFADLKDAGVKESVRQYVTIRSTAVTVAGIEGVWDDFALEKEYGWTTYSRVIIPFKDRFFCFLGTIGRDQAVAEYKQVFRKIIESFEIRK